MKKVIAVDLGTYFSEVSHVNKSGVVEVIPNSDGELKTPSVVSLAYEEPIVGKAALIDLILNPECVVRCCKRYMGKTTDDNRPIPITTNPAGEEKTPVDISAMILAHLKEYAEDYLGCEVTDGVITVPAYFAATARDATKAAARIAGFANVRLQDEPAAAALYYGLEKGRDETVVVVDYGGGTLDVTAVEVRAGTVQAVVTDGDAELGGTNYDEEILAFMIRQAKSEGFEISAEKDLATFYQNLDRVREAKEMLSRREETILIAEAEGKRTAITFTHQILRAVGKPFDKRFIACCNSINKQLKAKGKEVAVHKAKDVNPDQVIPMDDGDFKDL